MTTFVWNLLLAVLWATALDDLSPRGLLVGMVVGYLVLAAAWRLGADRGGRGGAYFRKVAQTVGFAGWFIRELVVANVRMARYTISPLRTMRSGIVAVPIEHDLTDLEITTLANLVSLTPGTLTLDVSSDRRVLFVHAMDASNPDEVRREVKQGFERRVRGLLR